MRALGGSIVPRRVVRRFIGAASSTVSCAMAFFGATASAGAHVVLPLGQVVPAAPENWALGDAKVTPHIAVRARGESRAYGPEMGGTNLSGEGAGEVPFAAAVATRARLGASIEYKWLTGRVILQDARVWGGSPAVGGSLAANGIGVAGPTSVVTGGGGALGVPHVGGFGAFEAYAEMRTAGARPSYLRVGRQVFELGDGLLVGQADASPSGRSLDAVVGSWAFVDGEVRVLAAMLAASQPAGVPFGATLGPSVAGAGLFGATGRYQLLRGLGLEGAVLVRVADVPGASPDGSTFGRAARGGETVTGALRAAGSVGAFSYAVEGMAQGGRANARDGAWVPRAAFAGVASARYRIDALVGAPTVRASFAAATGDGGTGTYTQFDPLLPDPNVHFGLLDAFALSNLLQPSLGVGWEPLDGIALDATYRYARVWSDSGEWLNGYLQTIAGSGAGQARDLGHELDFCARYVPWQPLSVRAGYGLLFYGGGAKDRMAARGRGTPDVGHGGLVELTLRLP